jgi:uncharacterized membrane protein YccC
MQENTERPGAIVPRMEGASQSSKSPRIDVRRLGKRMLLALIIPCAVAIGVDFAVGTWPLATLLTAIVAFPLAGLLVMSAALEELRKVIDEVAPEPSEDSELGVETGEPSVTHGA